MATKIYTKTGDLGETGLIGGTRVSKANSRIDAYGQLDELNSYIGLCRDLLTDAAGRTLLQEIQDRLFTIGSTLACDPNKEPKMQIPDLHPSDIELLEKEIDRMNESLEPMKFFVLPGGHPTISQLHVARCICRRAERAIVFLHEQGGKVAPIILQYLNRLSDYLFVLTRYTTHQLNISEIPWRPRK